MKKQVMVGPVPIIGLGVYRSPAGDATKQAVISALKLGYRHIDTATIYQNEEDVGNAIRESGVPREEIFVTTKVWTGGGGSSNTPYEDTIKGVDSSLKRLGLSYVDLILLHSPHGNRLENYRGLEKCLQDGKVKYIGVSNFGEHHLKELLDVCKTKPLVNQIEVHVFLQRKELCEFCKQNGIFVEAYSPLAKASDLTNPVLTELSKGKGKTVAQIMLRYLIQRGLIILPKSEKSTRQLENMSVFDFELNEEEMKQFDKLDSGKTTGWDPTTID